MKKIYPVILSVFLIYFSFYYTDRVIDIIRNTDPIMMKIKKEKNNYEVSPKNAKINENKIIPGTNGKKVNIKESYLKMKRYGTYNDSLYVFEEEEPNVTIDDYFDKYVESGKKNNNEVALIFTIKRFDNIDNIKKTLEEKEEKATFFIDGLFIENNYNIIKSLKDNNHELELLSYNDGYQREYFVEGLHSLFNITNKTPKFCFSTYDSKEVLDLCNSLNMHTIIPSINIDSGRLKILKDKLENGSIINIQNTDNLNIIIDYIKQRGYKLTTLENLISESLEK